MADYVLAARDDEDRATEAERLALLQAFHDPLTVRAFEAVGVAAGWRCLEVGAGAGSMTRWLSGRVAPAGRVLAVDLDPSPVAAMGLANVEARRADVLADPLPGGFDLVYSRLVLLHLPRRREALARMAAALRPGGWLVLQDVDFRGHGPVEPDAAYARVFEAFLRRVREAGWEPSCGALLGAGLRAAGLAEVAQRSWFGEVAGGSVRCLIQGLTYERLRAQIVATGLAGDADVDAARALLADPARRELGPRVWTAWGRRADAPR